MWSRFHCWAVCIIAINAYLHDGDYIYGMHTVNYAGAIRSESIGGEISAEEAVQAEQFMLEFMREDVVIIEALQKGLVANRGGAPYCEMEKTNWEFGRYIVEQICAEQRSG